MEAYQEKEIFFLAAILLLQESLSLSSPLELPPNWILQLFWPPNSGDSNSEYLTYPQF